MKSYKVSLKETYGLEGGELECMLSESPFDVPAPEWRRPAVVVVPGGGYCMVSKREGEPRGELFSRQRIPDLHSHLSHLYGGLLLSRTTHRTGGGGGLHKEECGGVLGQSRGNFCRGLFRGRAFDRGFSGGVCVRQRKNGHGTRLSAQSHRIGISRYLFQGRT